MALTQLTLVVPGLLGPFAGDALIPEMTAPALLSLLNRAVPVHNASRDAFEWLFSRFGITKSQQGDWPVGPVAAQLETGNAREGYWLCADPVHLRPDRSHLILFGPEPLAIQQAEADALVQSFNALYQADGWQLFAPTPDRWYLRIPDAPHIQTTPLSQVIGRDIDAHLPSGPEARRWHGLLNEVQMLLHSHTVNEQRLAQGQPAINSLWLWGGGFLPDVQPPAESWGYSDNVLVKGLMQVAGMPAISSPGDALEHWLPEQLVRGPGLVMLESCQRALQYGDFGKWQQAQEQMERQWWQPLLGLREQQQLQSFTIYPLAGNSYRLGKRHWREGWRRKRGWEYFRAE